MKALLYARVSTQEQADRDTIELQRDAARRYCEAQGIELVELFEDADVSGTIMFPERPAGARLLREAPDLRARGVSLVLVYTWSRVGREPWVVWGAVYDLEQRSGFRIKSLTEDADTSTPEKVLLLCLKSGVDSMERHQFLKRSMDASAMLARAGTWLGGVPPYGYRLEGHARHCRVVIDDAPLPGVPEAYGLTAGEVVRRIYEWAQGGDTLATIAVRLNGLGIPPTAAPQARSGAAAHWSGGRVRSLLVNPIYKGELQYGKTRGKGSKRPPELITSEVPALVPVEAWDAARAALTARRRYARRNTLRPYLLRSLLVCAACGRGWYCRAFHLSYASKEQPAVYYCGGRRTDGRPAPLCGVPHLPAPEADAKIWARVEERLQQPGFVDELFRTETDDTGGVIARRLGELREALERSETGRNRVITWARQGLISEGEMGIQLQAWRSEEAALRAEWDRLAPQARTLAELEQQREGAAAVLEGTRQEMAEELDFEGRRRILLRHVERIVVTVTAEEHQLDVVYRRRLK